MNRSKPMVARCPECGEKFKDPLLFVARVSMQEHRAEAHPAAGDPS